MFVIAELQIKRQSEIIELSYLNLAANYEILVLTIPSESNCFVETPVREQKASIVSNSVQFSNKCHLKAVYL